MPETSEEQLHVRRSLSLTFREKYVWPWLTPVIVVLALGTLFTGGLGFFIQYYSKSHDPSDWTVPFFKTFQLYILNSGSEDDADHPSNYALGIARFCAAMLFLVVSSTVIGRVLDEIRRLPRRMRQTDHAVICGLGQIGLQILDDLHADGRARNAVVIEPDATNPWLQYARDLGADVVIGDATRRDILQKGHVEQAKAVFVVTGDDGVNLEVAAEVAAIVHLYRKQPSAKLAMYVHIVDINLAVALQPHTQTLHSTEQVDVRVFNVPRTAAGLLATHQLWDFAPTTPDEVAHFIILGFGAMGQALAAQLAQLAHFPNLKRSRFTIVDRDIGKSSREFLSRFPRFCPWTLQSQGVTAFSPETDQWTDSSGPLPDGICVEEKDAIQYVCNAHFRELPPTTGDELLAIDLKKLMDEPGVKPIVFVCGQEDRDNFDSAVRLQEKLLCQGIREIEKVPIFVWLPKQPALVTALMNIPKSQLIPFGECRRAASLVEISRPIREEIGRAFHDDYERKSNPNGTIQNPWSDAPEAFRESNRQAADHLTIKLALLGYELHRVEEISTRESLPKDLFEKHKEVLARMEHNRWVAERLMSGWRFVPKASTKEEIKAKKKLKLNYNIVPWDQPDCDRSRDFEQLEAFLKECEGKGSFTLKRKPKNGSEPT